MLRIYPFLRATSESLEGPRGTAVVKPVAMCCIDMVWMPLECSSFRFRQAAASSPSPPAIEMGDCCEVVVRLR